VCPAHSDVIDPLKEYAPGTLPIFFVELRVFPCSRFFLGTMLLSTR
jgi:hypothetical protein